MRALTSTHEKLAHLVVSAVVAGLAVVGLVACGGNDASSAPSPTVVATTVPSAAPTDTPAAMIEPTATSSGGMSGSEENATATLKEWSISLTPADVSAGKVKYTVTNDGELTHDLVILDSSGNQVGATAKFGKAENPQTLEVDLKPGTYTFLCDIPGHAQSGMKTEVTVK